jgi:hypothetical protein
VKIVSPYKKLGEFVLPLKINGNTNHLDLQEFLRRNQENRKKPRGFLQKLSELPEKLEICVAKKIIKTMQKQAATYRFDENYIQSDLYNKLVDTLFEYFGDAFIEPDDESQLSDTALALPTDLMIVRSKAILRTLDQLYFKPGKNDNALSFDLRKLFILASNRALSEIIIADGLFTNGSHHRALSRFESLTKKTPHPSVEIPSQYKKPLRAYMPVQTHELDWQNQYLKAVSEVFHLSQDESESLIKNLGLFDESKVKLEGFFRTGFTMPYLNVASKIIDASIIEGLHDPEVDKIPMSTVVHEITHGLLKNRYLEFFTLNANDKLKIKYDDLRVNMQTLEGLKTYPIKHLEELICFALTIYVNPITTIRKLASIKTDTTRPDSYSMAADYAKKLMFKYKLTDHKQYTATNLDAIKAEALNLAKQNINLLDRLKNELVKEF